MPISRDEFDRGRKMAPIEAPLLRFLQLNRDKAYTVTELAKLVGRREFGVNFFIDVTNVALYERGLEDLVKEGRIEKKLVGEETYYRALPLKRYVVR